MNGLLRWQRPQVSGWAGFGRLTDLRDEIDRLFEAPLAELTRTSHLLSGWTPAMDVYENPEAVVVRVEVPGMKKEDIEVSLHDGSLSISGERKSELQGKPSAEKNQPEVYRAERFFGRFQRTVSLPTLVASDKVKAEYTDGILTVTLPKAEEAKPKHIDVQVN